MLFLLERTSSLSRFAITRSLICILSSLSVFFFLSVCLSFFLSHCLLLSEEESISFFKRYFLRNTVVDSLEAKWVQREVPLSSSQNVLLVSPDFSSSN